jgi:hypothetical protein
MLWNQAHAPVLQEHDLKHLGLVDLISTNQNKLPSFIDRFHHFGTLFFNVVEGKVMKVLMVNFVDATKTITQRGHKKKFFIICIVCVHPFVAF